MKIAMIAGDLCAGTGLVCSRHASGAAACGCSGDDLDERTSVSVPAAPGTITIQSTRLVSHCRDFAEQHQSGSFAANSAASRLYLFRK